MQLTFVAVTKCNIDKGRRFALLQHYQVLKLTYNRLERRFGAGRANTNSFAEKYEHLDCRKRTRERSEAPNNRMHAAGEVTASSTSSNRKKVLPGGEYGPPTDLPRVI